MIYSYDTLKTFLPENKPKLVFLGTMCSAVIRHKSDTKLVNFNDISDKKMFYYHDGRNKFWKILQYFFGKNSQVPTYPEDRRKFADSHGMAFMNLVQEVYVSRDLAKKSSDDILFDVFNENKENLKFKKIDDDAKKVLLEAENIFFTCKEKEEIIDFLKCYFEYNGLSKDLYKKIDFLCSPVAQCSVQTVCDRWLESKKLKLLVSNYAS